MPSTPPIRVALFGIGSSATLFHLPFLLARPHQFEVVAVLDRKGLEGSRRLPGARIVSTWQDLVRDADYDLGIVTLPNSLHSEVACRILESGRSVVIEKPLSVTLEEADLVLEAERRSGKTAFIYHNRRLDSDFLSVRRLLDSGHLGRLVRVEIRMDRWSPALRKKAWKETGEVGSTLLEDLGSHMLDQSLQLFGLPCALTCRTAVQREGSLAGDAFRISLDYEGFWVDLEASLVARSSPFHWLLQGTGGTFMKGGVDPQEAQLAAGLSPLDPSFGLEAAELAAELVGAEGDLSRVESPRGHYGAFYDEVWGSLNQGRTSAFAAAQGREVVRLLSLARQSQALAQMIRIP